MPSLGWQAICRSLLEDKYKMTDFIPIVITLIAGIAIGVIAMRLSQSTSAQGQPSDAAATEPQEISKTQPVSITAMGDDNGPSNPVIPFYARYSKRQMILGAAGVFSVAAVAVIATGSGDNSSAQSTGANTAATMPGTPAAPIDDVDSMINKLAERLKTNPTDGEGFRMLGWSYQNTNRPALAVEAYKTALALLPNRADVHAGYGEALVSVANGKVTSDAKGHFDTALKIDATQPRAKYFSAIYKSQNGQEREALDDFVALANGAPASEPWQAELRKQGATLGQKIGVNFESRMKEPTQASPATTISLKGQGGPTPEDVATASKLPPADQSKMIDGMVTGLANKLKANPDDPDGWVKLIRSRVVLGQKDMAKSDMALARKQFAGKPDILKGINALETELGL
jgi:cytochrome c-type biogenesis protein CcmH